MLSSLPFFSCLNGSGHKYETDEPSINSAGIFGAPISNGKSIEHEDPTSTTPEMTETELSTISSTTTLLPNLVVNQRLEFYEGWDPKHYK